MYGEYRKIEIGDKRVIPTVHIDLFFKKGRLENTVNILGRRHTRTAGLEWIRISERAIEYAQNEDEIKRKCFYGRRF